MRIFFIFYFLSISACFSNNTQKIEANNICDVLEKNMDWYYSLEDVEKKWNVRKDLILAFIHQESRFQSDARPHKDAHVANNTPSNAYGFAQVKEETWDWYQTKTQHYNAKRDVFADAVDFMGWYINESSKRLKISKRDVVKQYLAYHEGQGGFEQRTFLKKPWLLKVVKKVLIKSRLYRSQLKRCEKRLLNL
jgi:hypothetical protein